MLNVDDWIANGFVFDDDGFLTDEGVCRLHASGKGEVINKLLAMNGLDASGCVSVETQRWISPCTSRAVDSSVSIQAVRVRRMPLRQRVSPLWLKKT